MRKLLFVLLIRSMTAKAIVIQKLKIFRSMRKNELNCKDFSRHCQGEHKNDGLTDSTVLIHLGAVKITLLFKVGV